MIRVMGDFKILFFNWSISAGLSLTKDVEFCPEYLSLSGAKLPQRNHNVNQTSDPVLRFNPSVLSFYINKWAVYKREQIMFACKLLMGAILFEALVKYFLCGF